MTDNLLVKTPDGNFPIKTKDTGAGHVVAQFLTDDAGAAISSDNPLTVVLAEPITIQGGDATADNQVEANTKLDTLHSDFTAQDVLVGPVNETAPTSDTASSGLNGRLQRIAQRLTAIFTTMTNGTLKAMIIDSAGEAITSAMRGSQQALSVQVVDAAGAQITSFATTGITRYATADAAFTARPANTTAYAAGDIWNQATTPGPLVFADCGMIPAGGGVIVDIVAVSSAAQTTGLQGELWLFDHAPTISGAIADNSPFALADAEHLTLVARIPFTASNTGDPTSGAGGNASGQAMSGAAFNCASGDTDLYGMVKVTNAYTPVSGEVLSFRIKVRT